MALYRLEAKVVQRSNGHSAIAGAAYRSGTLLQDRASGKAHDYQQKRGIVEARIMAPENAPGWVYDREELWNRAERAEKRWDAQPAREILLALPHELTDAERADLVYSFVEEMFVSRGMVADIAIHRPGRSGDERNDHAHILLTMRELDGEGFSSRKQRDWNKTELLEHWRKEWAQYQNRALENAGFEERVDHRTLEAQGNPHAPTLHMGKDATALERAGITTRIGDENRKIQAYNERIDQLLAEYAELDAQIAAELEAELSEPESEELLTAEGAVGKKEPGEIEAEEGVFHIGAISNPLNLPASVLDEIKGIRDVFDRVTGKEEARQEAPAPEEPELTWEEQKASVDLFNSPIVRAYEKLIVSGPKIGWSKPKGEMSLEEGAVGKKEAAGEEHVLTWKEQKASVDVFASPIAQAYEKLIVSGPEPDSEKLVTAEGAVGKKEPAGSEPALTWEEQKASVDVFNSPLVRAYDESIRRYGRIREFGLGKNWFDRSLTMFENIYYNTITYVRTAYERLVGGNEDPDIGQDVEPEDYEPGG